MLRGISTSLVCGLLLSVLPSVSLLAQNETAIVGSVKDVSGSSIAGAKVTLKKVSTNESFTTVTNTSGDYRVFPLPLGEYEIRAEFGGFKTQVKSGVVLQVGKVERVEFLLSVGDAAQTVEVTAQASLINTENATFGQVIDEKKLSGLPLNTRDFATLASLAPGVNAPRGTIYGSGGAGGTQTGIEVAGMSRNDNGFYLNGTLVTDGNGSTSFRPNIDALQEFEIKTGQYGSEYGIRPGGQIIVVTKSGTNQYHGNAFEFYRSSDLAARNFFQAQKTPYKRNQFGGTFGGPISIPHVVNGKDKLWFFVGYQQEVIRNFVPLTGIVPTAAQRGGQFTTVIRDPLSGQSFANNLIPAARINPISSKLLNFYPEPNTSGALNFTSPNSSANTNEPQVMARVDFRRNDNDRYSTSFAWNSAFNLATSAISEFSYRQPIKTWTDEFTNTRNFRARFVNVFSVHFFRRPYALGQANPHVDAARALGIPDLSLSRINPNGGLPVVNITGLLSIGDSGSPPGGAANLGNWQVKDGLAFQQGSHFLKLGGEFRQAYNLFNIATSPSVGFTNRYSGNPLADFLLGYPTNTSTGGESNRGRFAAYSVYSYIQDDWKISQKVTLNLGLRYELRLPWKDVRGFMSNFSPFNGQGFNPPLLNQTLQPWETGRFQPDASLVTWNKFGGFQPRVGLAYRLSGRTVVRMGYGMYGNELDVAVMQQLGANPRPNAARQVFNASAATPNISFSDPFPAALSASAIPTYTGIQSPLNLPTTHSWGFSVEREIRRDVMIEAAYQGSHTSNLLHNVSVNDAVPGPGTRQSRRPFPAYQEIQITQSSADAWYQSLQLKAQKRAGADGFSLLGSFTWSKALNTMDVNTNILGSQRIRSANMPLYLNKSNSVTDIPVRLVITAGYELPFGRGKRFLQKGIAAAIAGGWQIQGISVAQTGPWFTAFLPGDALDTGSTYSQWPDLVRNPNLPASERTPTRWFDTTAFATPGQYKYGNAGRSPLQGPGLINFDLSLQRHIRITERQRVFLRLDAFNALNHANFNIPGQSFGTGAFGVVGSALDPRIVQLGVKYHF